jgi:hypothetical protein
MDVQKQDSELNGGKLFVSSLKDSCAIIKYEEHTVATGFPLILCDHQVNYWLGAFIFLVIVNSL